MTETNNNSTQDPNIRFRLKANGLELEFEGSGTFLREHVEEIAQTVLDLAGLHVQSVVPSDVIALNGNDLQMTTSNVAAKMGGRTGTEIALAACTKLRLVDARETFGRRDILVEMKGAPSFYKEMYRKNLTSILDGLVKADKLREVSPQTYAIEARTLSTIQSQFALMEN